MPLLLKKKLTQLLNEEKSSEQFINNIILTKLLEYNNDSIVIKHGLVTRFAMGNQAGVPSLYARHWNSKYIKI